MSHENGAQKLVLFIPINAAGHLNSSVAIADRLRDDHNYKSVFLLVGPPPSSTIESHGHQLLQLDEVEPLEDWELEEGEDSAQPVDEERKLREGKRKKIFVGAFKWPQLIARHQHLFKRTPLEAFQATAGLIGDFLVPNTTANNAAMEREIERLQPDLIVCDSYLPPPIVMLHEQTCPWVRLQTGNPLAVVRSKLAGVEVKQTSRLYTKEERERMRCEAPEKWQALLAEWSATSEQIKSFFATAYAAMRDFYQRNNCDRLDVGKSALSSPHLNVYMFPKAIDYDQDDDLLEYPPRWVGCDSLLRKPIGESELSEVTFWRRELERRLSERPHLKIVYFSLGSIASGDLNLMAKYMQILASDPEERLYVVSKGVNGHKYELNERNMLGANYLPQPFLLQRAHLAIIHGGNNSITECLYYGRPTIVLPNFSDQFDNAQRLEDLKLGKTFNVYHCQRDELLAAVGELLADEPLQERLATISKAMQARDDLGKVSELLRGLLEAKQLSADLARKHNIRLD